MAHRIVPTAPVAAGKDTHRVQAEPYLVFVASLPCIISLLRPADAAHLSLRSKLYLHLGSGMARKASDRWTLPLHRSLHDEQTNRGDELAFWDKYQIDPYLAALVIHGLWTDYGERARDRIETAINEHRWRGTA